MHTNPETVRVTGTCPVCSTDNDLTINHVSDDQPLTCSTCGGHLGTLAQLRVPMEAVGQNRSAERNRNG
jgi:hypothetical protein